MLEIAETIFGVNLWLTAVGKFYKGVASLLTFQRVDKRQVWSDQTRKFTDFNQPIADIASANRTGVQ